MNTQFEPLSKENADDLSSLMVELWPETNVDQEKNYCLERINDPGHFFGLCRYDGAAVGFVHISIREGFVDAAEGFPVAYLEGIYLQPGFRKKGGATDLLRRGEEWAKQKGMRQIASDTQLLNRKGVSFHRRTGFQEVERIITFIKELD